MPSVMPYFTPLPYFTSFVWPFLGIDNLSIDVLELNPNTDTVAIESNTLKSIGRIIFSVRIQFQYVNAQIIYAQERSNKGCKIWQGCKIWHDTGHRLEFHLVEMWITSKSAVFLEKIWTMEYLYKPSKYYCGFR